MAIRSSLFPHELRLRPSQPDPRTGSADRRRFPAIEGARCHSDPQLQSEDDCADGGMENERNAALGFGMSFTNLPVTDFDRLELLSKLPKCVVVLEQSLAAGNTLYEHCTAGVNRSPTVIVAYLHQTLKWPLEQALEHVLSCRNCCPDEEIIRKASG
jgi:dual specificity protein phosphatase-like protein